MEASRSSSRQRGKRVSLKESVRENLTKTLKEKNMHFRFKAVEDTVAPLIHQVKSFLARDCSKLEGLVPILRSHL